MSCFLHKTTISSESATFSPALTNILNPLSDASGFRERVFLWSEYGSFPSVQRTFRRSTGASPQTSGTSGGVRKLPHNPAYLPEMYGSFPTIQRTFRRCTDASPQSSGTSGDVRMLPHNPANLPEVYGNKEQLFFSEFIFFLVTFLTHLAAFHSKRLNYN